MTLPSERYMPSLPTGLDGNDALLPYAYSPNALKRLRRTECRPFQDVSAIFALTASQPPAGVTVLRL